MDIVKVGDEFDKKVSAIDTERALLATERIGLVTSYILGHFDQKTKSNTKSSQSVGLSEGDKFWTPVMCDTLKQLTKPVTVALGKDDLLWPQTSENKPLMKALVYVALRRTRKEAGLTEDTSPHDYRPTHIRWIKKRCPETPPTTLEERVGHSPNGVTDVNHTRPLALSQTRLRESLESVMR